MSEEMTLLPCPACGNPDAVVSVTTRAAVSCPNCGLCGPCAPKVNAEYAIRQWNAMPRTMTWTDEPQLGAWNWWRDEDSRLPRYIFHDGTVAIAMQIDRVPYQDLDGQWCPIPEPCDHREIRKIG